MLYLDCSKEQNHCWHQTAETKQRASEASVRVWERERNRKKGEKQRNKRCSREKRQQCLLRLTIETKPTHALHSRPHTKFKYFVTFVRCLFCFGFSLACVCMLCMQAWLFMLPTQPNASAMRCDQDRIEKSLFTEIWYAHRVSNMSYDLSHSDCIRVRNEKQLHYTHTSLSAGFANLYQSQQLFESKHKTSATKSIWILYETQRLFPSTSRHSFLNVYLLTNEHKLYSDYDTFSILDTFTIITLWVFIADKQLKQWLRLNLLIDILLLTPTP